MTNVLIVEDEQAIRRFLRAALEGDGLRVYEAETLQRGLLEAATRKPDLIILDLGLPDGDGIDFIRDLRQWSAIPVIVLSARSEESDKIAALDAGADDYLSKPFGIGYEYQNGRWIFYFHGARTGKKMRLLRKNPAVCIEMDGDHALLRADDPCDYSYAYTSVFATGLASILQTREEMRYGLDVIMRQTDPGKTFSYREDMMKAVCVVRIECDALTCRRHLATQSE